MRIEKHNSSLNNRNSNIEFLRIISMCGIISLHYFNPSLGGITQNVVFPSFSWLFSFFCNSFTVPMVNCFVLITGYFMVSKTESKHSRILEIIEMTTLYGVSSYLIAVIAGHANLSWQECIYSIMPFLAGRRWFVQTYVILLLIAPFLSKVLLQLKENEYKYLVCVLVSVFSLWYSIGKNTSIFRLPISSPVSDNGYGIQNFVLLFILGGWINRFRQLSFFKLSNISYLVIYLVSSIVTFINSYFSDPFGYAYITNIVGACALFLFFVNLPVRHNEIINRISKATLDAYFVHSEKWTSGLLISHLLFGEAVVDKPIMIPHMIITIIVIWMIGYLMYCIRKWLFRTTGIYKLNSRIKEFSI